MTEDSRAMPMPNVVTVDFPDGTTEPFTDAGHHPNGDRILRGVGHPPRGKRWNLRNVPDGAPVVVDGVTYTKTGATSRTMRVRKMPEVTP